MNTLTSDQKAFIDLHCHIIPNVDDGPKTYQDSIDMAKVATQQGFSKIFATPHFSPTYDSLKKLDQIKKNLFLLNEHISKQGYDLKIEQGYELFISKNMLYNKDLHEYCLGNTNYLLAEVHPSSSMSWLPDFIHELSIQNIKLILAHPERYTYLFQNSNFIYEIKNAGILFQVDLASIFGVYGRQIEKNTKLLIKNKLVDFFSSDAHRPSSRGFYFNEGIKKLRKHYTEEELEYLFITYPNSIF